MFALTPAFSLVLTLILGPPAWQAPETEGPMPEDLQPKLVELEGELAIIPFTLDGGRPIPLVEAMVNGKGPFLFFYDTGASVCVLDTGFVEELELTSLGKAEVGDHTANARISAERVEMATLEFDGIRFEGVPALAFDRSKLGGAKIRGVLGLPLFHDHLLTIDYQKGRMEISNQTLPEEGLGIVPYGGGLLPEMSISVGDKEISCHIDSGSPTGLMLPTSFVEGQTFKNDPTKIGQARTVNSVLDIWSVQLDATAIIAGTEFIDPIVVYNDMVPNALIGYQILKDMVLSIDQSSKRLRLLPTGTRSDLEEIERAVLDYAESYYEVAPEYAERSIHPELAKIGFVWKDGQWETHPMDYDGFMAMVQWFVQSERIPEPGPKEVVVLAATDQTALVKLTGSWGIDYMQLARFDDRWQTRHVVWQSAPEPRDVGALERDRAAVERAVRDYLAAMYKERSELIEKSVHPDMVALGFSRKAPEQDYRTREMTLEQLRERAGSWNFDGSKVSDVSPNEVKLLGVMDRVACVKLTAAWGVDYLNLIKGEDGNWLIMHVMSQAESVALGG
jgi:predicted aspartyl protease